MVHGGALWAGKDGAYDEVDPPTWPDATVQTCVVHMVRNSLRYASKKHWAMIRSWENSWAELVPFLEFPSELRKVVFTTNAIESLNAKFRRAVRHRGHFPTEQAALKVLYVVVTQRRPNRQDLTGRINGWKTILYALTVHYGDRIADHVR